MSKLELKNEAREIVRDFMEPLSGVTPLYALCDILGVKARTVAKNLNVTPSQLSHYRKGATDVSAEKMEIVIQLTEIAIKEFEKEIKRKREVSMNSIEKDLLVNLEFRAKTAIAVIDSYRS